MQRSSRTPPRAARRDSATARFALAALAFLLVFALPSSFHVDAAAATASLRAPDAAAPYWVVPAAPCVEDEVHLAFEICTCNTQWIRLERTAEGLVRLDVLVDPRIVCVRCAPDTQSVSLGRFAAGSYIQRLEIVSHVVGVADSDSVIVEQGEVAFSVSPVCAGPNADPYLQRVLIGQPSPCEGCPQTACPGDSIPVILRGVLPAGCVRVREVRRLPSPLVGPLPAPDLIQIVYETCSTAPCTALLAPWSYALRISPLPSGTYNLIVQSQRVDTCSPDSIRVFDPRLEPFTVLSSCPSPPDSLPHVDQVMIGRGAPCPDCPQVACAGDSIPVRVRGHFDDDCIWLEEIRTAPNPSMSPMPMPDIVQVIYGYNSCIDRACLQGFYPWERTVRIGPLLPNAYGLNVEAYLRDECVPGSLTPLGRASFPFVVDDTCGIPPPPGCFRATFAHMDGGPCDAYVGPDHPGVADLVLIETTPVSGLQGRLQFDRPGLRVSAIEPLPAGALLSWQPTADGAKFVVVDASSAQSGGGTAGDVSWQVPLLRVHAEAVPGVPVSDVVRLVPLELVASDPLGQNVPECLVRANERYRDPAAYFCREAACDFNGDLTTDVRDLVLMLRCMRDTLSSCAGIDLARLDCNGDGVRDLDDVLCCARVLLGNGLPDSTRGEAAPDVTVQFGAPASVAGGIDVPVMLTGSSGLGAVRLAFDYPDAAFESASIEPAGASPSWLALDQAGGGRAVFGAIRLAPDLVLDRATGTPSLALVLHLRTRAGQRPSGEVRFTGGDFANLSGQALVTAADPVAMPLAGGSRVSLGAARPNPFASETRFSVVLAQDGDLEVAVYDLLGRKVATLFRGHASAGTREFTWRRVRDDGAAVGSGVYFYRASANGQSAGGKVLVLSRE